MGIATFVIFSIIFGILVDRFEHILEVINRRITFTSTDLGAADCNSLFIDECIVEQCVNWCYFLKESENTDSSGLLAKEKWTRRHIMDSWDQFWGGSLVCFLPVSYTHLTLPTNREV
eukprot:TRINITY_DN2606_c0_g1_i2.p1 TRINITY_DN2606_c0_g1~~TRINITY_DN2606_c0_g1_i2.p1  ORF type:complete len:117 (-),score=25.04 TRINITY_DN2606_c0_g1_i2:18-368(-)